MRQQHNSIPEIYGIGLIKPNNLESDLMIILPQINNTERKPRATQRRRNLDDEKVKKAQQKYGELFLQQEAIQEYLFENLTDRTERNQLHRTKQIYLRAKYASDYNYKWQQKHLEQKSIEKEMEQYYLQLFNEKRGNQQHKQQRSVQLPTIQRSPRQKSEPMNKPQLDTYHKKISKIVQCSYQKDLAILKRSQQIAAKLDQDEHRILTYKTLDCRPKFQLKKAHNIRTMGPIQEQPFLTSSQKE